MFSRGSIRKSFLIQLIFALAALIFLFSSMLYFYIEKSIYDEKRQELISYAKNIAANKSITEVDNVDDTFVSLNVEVVYLTKEYGDVDLYKGTKDGRTFLTLIYPFNLDDNSYLKITREVTHTKLLLDKILNYIFIINIAGFLLVVIYAIGLSKMLVTPVKTLTSKLSNMNEHLIHPIKVEELPEEFEPLGDTINHLISRIQNFVKYQKELFIGTALEPNGYMANLQIGLLNQIIQNFLQNALKFTPKDKSVTIRSSQNSTGLLIEVIDEGCGIDDSVDLFAPFKRQGNKSGVGLGLFLAKSAADGLGAKIKLQNREDGINGTIASLTLNSKLSCILPKKG